MLTTNSYIIKAFNEGVYTLTIHDLEAQRFSLKHLLDAKDQRKETTSGWVYTDCLSHLVTDSQIIVAATHNERVNKDKNKICIKVLKIPISEI